ncbi:ATP-dependent DNA helicase [Anabaena sp. FACHB-1237]|uniref:helicase C-terminal domain-containing protein n=1 Tax=Anabaena sp. FACHB-1237 TaxID=2692769 RepID=UPI0016800413|nr:ATP-dependent DNA helicase [Anabaena sp. FACHB-1237]MBD2136964.1 ATP-dependent DNA helicase [Anabaena sp. FACHB-1237]
MIEAEVHLSLHNFLRSQSGFPSWPHHLTMARLVARALRLDRSALIQVGALCGLQGRYRTSFIASALMWPNPVIVVATLEVQQRLLNIEIPRLQQWLSTHKPIRIGNTWPDDNFPGLLLTSPQAWFQAQLSNSTAFPPDIPTIIDGVDDLENWVCEQLTYHIQPTDWEQLMLSCPQQREIIRETRVKLTHELFQHPENPYNCYLISATEIDILQNLFLNLQGENLPKIWQSFSQDFPFCYHHIPSFLSWATINRRQGLFTLHYTHNEFHKALAPIWKRQPVVLIGSALEVETEAPLFRQRFGLPDVTCLRFSADTQGEAIQLYVPYKLPLPNTPEFQGALIHNIRTLVCLSATTLGITVVLVGDVPLKAKLGAILAGEFGSRVQVEKTCLDDNGILVTGWEFWRSHQNVLPSPRLLIIATLPLPSLENPLVAGRVAHYKRSHQDWFRLYLLPTAISELQRAIAPVRENQGIVALLDSRVVNRSYGSQILAALSPLARLNYLDPSLFSSDTQQE